MHCRGNASERHNTTIPAVAGAKQNTTDADTHNTHTQTDRNAKHMYVQLPEKEEPN